MPAIAVPPPPALYAQQIPDDIRRRAALPLTEFDIAVYDGDRLVWAGPMRTAGQGPGFRTGKAQGSVSISNSGPVASNCPVDPKCTRRRIQGIVRHQDGAEPISRRPGRFYHEPVVVAAQRGEGM